MDKIDKEKIPQNEEIMHKAILLFVFTVLTICLSASSDTSRVDSSLDSTLLGNKPELSFNGSLLSRNIWRGVNFGASPSIQALMVFGTEKLSLNTFFARSMNGGSFGYKSTSNIFLAYRPIKGLSIEVDDYFFYDEDNLDQYANWSDTTLHFIEGRLKYQWSELYVMTGYTLHANKYYDNKALYIEVGYSPRNDIAIVVGGLTGPSSLNFRKYGGLTNVSITKTKEVKMSDDICLSLYGSLVVNPSFNSVIVEEVEGVPNGVVASAVAFVLGLTF